MKAYEEITKVREYLDYLEEHVSNVEKAWEEVKTKCTDMRFMWDDFFYFHIEDAVKNHDLSKFSAEEFIPYKKYFYPTQEGKLNIDEVRKDFDLAWENHKNKNDHHWENWSVSESWYPNAWEISCVHMVVDWLAMSYKFNDSPRAYYEKNKEKINIPVYAVDFIYEIFERLEK